jgi:quercetin dioxygenase-like cupin family protein
MEVELQAVMQMDKKSSATEILANPLKLKELTAYQSGAIVSRTLVDQVGGTVTIFAFDEGQGLSEHTSPYDAMVIAVEGDVNIKISGESFDLKEGEMIIMPANKPHALKAVTKFKMILMMIRAGGKRNT